MGMPKEKYPDTKGMCVSFKHKETCNWICIVTLQDNAENLTDEHNITMTLLHEAVHVWQTMVEDINEREPSREFEAYMIEHITRQLVEAYKGTRLVYKYGNN